MADRSWYPVWGCLEREYVWIVGRWDVGATGAVSSRPSAGCGGTGITSLTRNSAGNYTIVLDDVYPKLLSWNIRATTAAGVDLVGELVSINEGTKTYVVQFKTGTVATDPASGSVLCIKLEFTNSSTTPLA
jgi:hypothetical protein